MASAITVFANLWQQLDYREDTFSIQANAVRNHVEDNVRLSESISLLMQIFLHSNPNFQQQDFTNFVDAVTEHYPFFSLSTYAPLIKHSQRQGFEQWIASNRYPAQSIYSVTQSDIVRTDDKAQYLPVQYIYPLINTTRRWIGLDCFDIRNTTQVQGIQKAIDTGQVIYSAPQFNRLDSIMRMNIYVPAYHGGQVPALTERQEKLSGLAILAIRPDLMMADNDLPPNYRLRLQSLDKGVVTGESRWQSLARLDSVIVRTFVNESEFSLVDKQALFTVTEEVAFSSLNHRELLLSLLSGWAIAAVLCFAYWARKDAQPNSSPTPMTNLPVAIGHEIKSTINTAYENLSQINEYEQDIDNHSKRAISTARHQCQYAMRTINTLLQIEKIQAGQLTVFKKPVDIVGLIKMSIDGNRSLALQKNTDFFLSTEQAEVIVNIDRSRIQQVIETLLINMAKASAEKNTVAITLSCNQHSVLIDMHCPHEPAVDAPSDIESNDSATPAGFSELQFNLCKALLEIHGGKLGVKTRSDHSHSIWCQLPLPSNQTSTA